MKKKLSKLLMVSVIAASSLTMQGCNDTDVALGAGLVAGVIIGAAVDSDHDHHRHHRPNPRRYKRHHGWSTTAQTFDTRNLEVSQKYNIHLEASKKIVTALDKVQAGQTSSLSELGLQKKDLIALHQGRMISNESLKNLSDKLELDRVITERMIQRIASEIKAKKAPESSDNMYERFY